MSLNPDAPTFQPGANNHQSSSRSNNRNNRRRNYKKSKYHGGRGRNNRGGRGARGNRRGRGRGNHNNRGKRDHRKKQLNISAPEVASSPTPDELEEKVEQATLPYDINDHGTTQCKSMTKELMVGAYNCIVCFGKIGKAAKIWACPQCYRIFHLSCAKEWDETLKKQDGDKKFRCPACQGTPPNAKFEDRCFCGYEQFPPLNTFLPHSCGEKCKRPRPHGCTHPCPIQCHPGPCPPCPHKGPERKCPCGKMNYQLQCGTAEAQPRTCEDLCSKTLSCGKHICTEDCHNGMCPPCTEMQEMTCFCGKVTKDRTCGTGEGPDGNSFCCEQICNQPLDCGNHTCQRVCHIGPCTPCDRKTGWPQRCGCGKQMLQRFKRRKTCLDPLPSCEEICGKLLACGNPEHVCLDVCHDGPCQPCKQKIKVRCACGKSRKTLPCAEVQKAMKNSLFGEVFRCKNRCGKHMSCRKHRCQEICCRGRQIDNYDAHICTEICTKMLNCGNHQCDSLCHTGKCNPCTVMLHDGVTCFCGEWHHPGSVRCGSAEAQIRCRNPCRRPRECGHQCPRVCHMDDCPPCTVLVTKYCAGGHKKMPCIPCHRKPRCEQKCGRLRRCGVHKCSRTCHSGVCEEEEFTEDDPSCGQECGLKMDCGHLCKQRCHPDTDCDSTNCQRKTYVTCPCDRRQKRVRCCRKRKIGYLVCDDQCVIAARNERFREALDIGNNIDKADFRIPPSVLEKLSNLRQADDFVKSLESTLRAFVNGKKFAKAKGFDQIGESKLEVGQSMAKDKISVIKEIAPKYGLKVETTGTLNYRFTALIKTSQTRIPPFQLSNELRLWRENPNRAKSLESFPPEQIVVLTSGSAEVVVEDLLALLTGLNVSFQLFETTDKYIMCFFKDRSMCDVAFPVISKKYKSRPGMNGDSEILFVSQLETLYSTEEELQKLKNAEIKYPPGLIKRTNPRSESAAFKKKGWEPEEEEIESANPFDGLEEEEVQPLGVSPETNISAPDESAV